jgi:hypothetical protein
MQKLLTLAALMGATMLSFAQGTVNFANSASTLISAGGVAMPVSGTTAFNFALFLAPSTTVNASGQSTTFTDPVFQTPTGVGNVNSAIAAGRVPTLNGYVTTGSGTVDFLVRGWSANAGSTWAQALAFWNNGSPAQDMWLGQSLIGNDLVLGGGAIPATTLFGLGSSQVPGFNLVCMCYPFPEPSSTALAGLGVVSLLMFRRRKKSFHSFTSSEAIRETILSVTP